MDYTQKGIYKLTKRAINFEKWTLKLDMVKRPKLISHKVVETSSVVSVPVKVGLRISFVIHWPVDDAIDGLNTPEKSRVKPFCIRRQKLVHHKQPKRENRLKLGRISFDREEEQHGDDVQVDAEPHDAQNRVH